MRLAISAMVIRAEAQNSISVRSSLEKLLDVLSCGYTSVMVMNMVSSSNAGLVLSTHFDKRVAPGRAARHSFQVVSVRNSLTRAVWPTPKFLPGAR